MRPARPVALRQVVLAVVVLGTATVGCSGGADDGANVRDATASAASGGAGPASGGASASSSSPPPCEATGMSDEPPDATIEARMSAFVIEAIPSEVPAGVVDLVPVNMGFEPHEVLILRYEGRVADLPTNDDGSLDEAALPDGTVVGRIEPFAGQQESPETVDDHDLILLNGPTACPAAFDLSPGDYLLVCNIVAEHYDGEVRAHFERGMHTPVTVT